MQYEAARHFVSEQTRKIFERAEAAESIRIIDELRRSGFEAFLAGGCVRDALLGRIPKDYDVATEATPNSVREVFGKRKTLAFGASFGVIGVLPNKQPLGDAKKSKAKSPVLPTEVATFRSDGTYSDGRRPDSVHFGNAEQDALRRDFTINGLFYDPSEGCVIDFVGGIDDLQKSRLHTIGDAHQRFDEDKLRMLRAVRFSTTMGFDLTGETRKAIVAHADTIALVSGERIGAEMRRILCHPNAMSGIELLESVNLANAVLPEWKIADQSRFRALMLNLARPSTPKALSCLLVTLPEKSLAPIVDRWKLSGDEQRAIRSAMKYHRVLVEAAERPWSEIQPLLIDRDIEVAIDVAEAVAKASEMDLDGIRLAINALTWDPKRLNPAPLLTGNDLASLGYEAGPAYTRLLRCLRKAQLDGQAFTRADAEQIVKSEYERMSCKD